MNTHVAFYASAVQVIPVLFLVLALEARRFQFERLPRAWEKRIGVEGWPENDLPKARRMVLGIIRKNVLRQQARSAVPVLYVAMAEIVGFIALLDDENPPFWMVVVVLGAVIWLLLQISLLAFGLPAEDDDEDDDEGEDRPPAVVIRREVVDDEND